MQCGVGAMEKILKMILKIFVFNSIITKQSHPKYFILFSSTVEIVARFFKCKCFLSRFSTYLLRMTRRKVLI